MCPITHSNHPTRGIHLQLDAAASKQNSFWSLGFSLRAGVGEGGVPSVASCSPGLGRRLWGLKASEEGQVLPMKTLILQQIPCKLGRPREVCRFWRTNLHPFSSMAEKEKPSPPIPDRAISCEHVRGIQVLPSPFLLIVHQEEAINHVVQY